MIASGGFWARVRGILDAVAGRPELAVVALALLAYATIARLSRLTGRPGDAVLVTLAVLVFGLLSQAR